MTCTKIKTMVEIETGVSNIATKNRIRYISDARKVYYKLCFEYATDYTSKHCARILNYSQHGTVLHGLKQFDDIIDDSSFKFYKDCYTKIAKIIKRQRRFIVTKKGRLNQFNRSLTNRINA